MHKPFNLINTHTFSTNRCENMHVFMKNNMPEIDLIPHITYFGLRPSAFSECERCEKKKQNNMKKPTKNTRMNLEYSREEEENNRRLPHNRSIAQQGHTSVAFCFFF